MPGFVVVEILTPAPSAHSSLLTGAKIPLFSVAKIEKNYFIFSFHKYYLIL